MAPQQTESNIFNHLRRGTTYSAITQNGISVGEYLGMEVSYGEWAIMLRQGAATESISLRHVNSIVSA